LNADGFTSLSHEVVLPDLSEGWDAVELHRDPTVGSRPRSGPEVKNGRSGAEDGTPDRLRCVTVKEKVSQILQRVFTDAA